MAKAAWCSTLPISGTGNGTVAVSGSAHTGRKQRSTILTFSASGATNQTVTVNQASPGNVTTMSTPSTIIAKGGGSIIVSGTSNSTTLTFGISGTGFSTSTPQISTDGGSTWTGITSGTDISEDPGATATYQWRITVTATANPDTTSRSATLTVTPEKGTAVTGTIIQSASEIF